MQKHCCEKMNLILDEGQVSFRYYPIYRAYGISHMGCKGVCQLIEYCPWCGIQLPTDLHDTYASVLEEEYSIDAWDWEQEKLIPREFKSDKWWKIRGL